MKKILPLILALVVFISLAFGYGFMYRQVAGGAARAAAALSQAATLGERDALVRSQQIFLENVATDLETLNTYVADDAEVIALIETVEGTARAEGVTALVSSVSTTDVSGWGFHEGVVITFSSSGTFANTMRFIAALEALPRASRLTESSLEVSSEGTWFGAFSIMFVKLK